MTTAVELTASERSERSQATAGSAEVASVKMTYDGPVNAHRATLILLVFGAISCPRRSPGPALDRVPPGAVAVGVFGYQMLANFRELGAGDEETRKELAGYLERTVGIDLTNVEDAVVFVVGLQPALEMAVRLGIPGSGELKLPGAGNHAGHPLYALEGELVAARVPGAILIGTRGAVEAGIDAAPGAARAAAGSPVALLEKTATGEAWLALAAQVPAGLDRSIDAARQTYGLKSLLAVVDAQQAQLTLFGEPARLPLLRSGFLGMRDVALTQARLARDKAKSGNDVLEGVATILAYHQMSRLFHDLEPRLTADQLVFQMKLPKMGGTAGVVAMVGVLSAVAIPAFMKYIRRSKTTEASLNLGKLSIAVSAYYVEHARFPPSTEWTPQRRCCEGPAEHCTLEPALWARGPWADLQFQPGDEFRYQYRLIASGEGASARLTVEARGDLDCNGVFSSYRREITVDSQGMPNAGPLQVERDLE
jgi:type IV pilus assembly protein PilA